jgi:hypothetical protein
VNTEWSEMESLLEIKTNQHIESRLHSIKLIGCQIDQQFLDWKARNNKVVKSLDLQEHGIMDRKMLTITAVINRDTFFTEESLTLELVVCNGTSKMTFEKLFVDLFKTTEYIYDKKSMIGRIQKYKTRLESVMQYVIHKNITPGQRLEFVRDFEIPATLQESTLMKDAIVRTSYSLQVSIPNRSEFIVFPLYIINTQGTTKKRQNIKLQKSFSNQGVVDDFEIVDEDVGFVDQGQPLESTHKSTQIRHETAQFDQEVEEISRLLKEK